MHCPLVGPLGLIAAIALLAPLLACWERPRPVMSARERNLFLRRLSLDELAKMPEGTTAGGVMSIVETRLAELERLRQREGE